jgi:hypothetical protein
MTKQNYELEIGEELPDKPRANGAAQTKYPWAALYPVGSGEGLPSSFFQPGAKVASFASNIAAKNRKAGPEGPTYRAVLAEKNGIVGVRVFRIT